MALDHMASLLSSGEYSDCTIECEGHVFQVHKNVVCPQSPVFKAAFLGSFEEAKTSTFKIDGFSTDTVRTMLRFMYGDNDVLTEKIPGDENAAGSEIKYSSTLLSPQLAVEDVANGESQEEAPVVPLMPSPVLNRLLWLIRINIIADFYAIESLRDKVNDDIRAIFENDWCPVVFGNAVQVVVEEVADKDLRRIFCKAVADHLVQLAKHSVDFTGLLMLDGSMQSFLEACTSRIALLTGLVNTYSSEVKDKDAALVAAQTNANEVIDGIKKAISTLQKIPHCRQCKDKSGFYIENVIDYKKYTIRCKDCTTRHPVQ